MDDNLSEIRYQLFSLKFTPLNGVKKTSKDIVFDIVTFISNKLFQEKEGYLIDKYHNRPNNKREMFMNRAVILPREHRIRCSMALLRNKNPLIKPHEEFKLIPVNEALGSIAEETHFFIDYSKNPVVICCEYHHEGPRISDIEYYFRDIAHRELRLSKATTVDTFLDAPIDDVLSKLKMF